jgi:2-oxoisovalerate dehydrogenase E1 component
MPKRKSTKPKLSSIDWREVARLVLLARELDELEERELTPDKNPRADMMVKYQFSSSGHELAQVLLALSLNHPHDAANVYYRSRPFMLASGLTVREALAGGMARAGSVTEGRDVGVTFNMPRRSGAVVLPMCGDVGSQYTPAAGWAQSIDYHIRVLGEKEWQGAIAVAFGGEASTATNGFWSALNIATTLKLRILFSSKTTHSDLCAQQLANTRRRHRANLASFSNLRVIHGDGADPTDAPPKVAEAVRYVRAGKGPALLHLRVPRLKGHTTVRTHAPTKVKNY